MQDQNTKPEPSAGAAIWNLIVLFLAVFAIVWGVKTYLAAGN